MEKQTLAAICDNISVWEEWREDYGELVPKFIEEAAKGGNWSDWNEKVFEEYFMRTNNQCISSLRQGYFTHKERDEIKEHWAEIAPLLQKIALEQETPQYDVYQELKAVIRKYTDNDKRAATNRMIAGLQPQLLCTIVNQNMLWDLFHRLSNHVEGFDLEWKSTWFENSYQVLQLFKQATGKDGYEVITYPWQVYEEHHFDGNNNKTPDMSENSAAVIIDLLKYKKQVILQGPPGTGKTRLAKEIAETLTGAATQEALTKDDIIANCRQPAEITAAKTQLKYKVLGVNDSGVRVENSEGKEYTALFNEIVRMYEQRAWEKEGLIVNGTQSYSAAVAKYLHARLGAPATTAAGSYKIIQFHPSYTYEDFVRGIVSKPNPDGEGVLYETENKTLAKFADEAYQNYMLDKLNPKETAAVPLNRFADFIDHLKEQIADSDEQKLQITDAVYLYEPDDKKFKYKGDNWKAHINGLNMKYSELEKIIATGETERSKVKTIPGVEGLTRHHSSYFTKVVEMYYSYLKDHPVPAKAEQVTTKPKNYVLIIDEINRANLSSVLGELIYALEYRGQPVDGIYEIDGEHQLILPPNFYIIGTMNTADRSVGHIDYAIRRRFAFVDVLPEVLGEDVHIYFNTEGYNKVKRLFNREHVSSEFEAKDVQIGHSYFIVEKKDVKSELERDELFALKMEYEVVPILNEYVRDGILIGKIDEQDIKDYITSLKKG